MKKIIPVLLFIISLNSFSQTTKKALFLGNSYTYVNNLPQITADIASNMGDNLIFDSNCPGGYTLQGHSTNTTSLTKIMVGNWDYVVLQEQSQLPSFDIAQVQIDVFPYAKTLDSTINFYNSCAETMFYMTWGRKNGDASNCASWPPVCTYSGMDSLLNMRYQMMADSNNAVVSAVGAVWKNIRLNYPLIELYQADESHPSEAGSYAAACCFYTSMFRKNPLLISYNYTLSASDAANIRSAVKTIVYDNLINYNIAAYDPIANFNYTAVAGNVLTFINQSSNASSYIWYFGDGDSASVSNPVHTYPSSGNFTVMLIANYCSYSDTTTLLISTTPTGINTYFLSDLKIYPNPVNEILSIQLQNIKIENVMLLDVLGRYLEFIYQMDENKINIDFKSFSPGIYFIKVNADDKLFSQKIIKQ
ncbi:hypothetical protein BH10BAC1_BH10BAC1_21550 [soil metagenome]